MHFMYETPVKPSSSQGVLAGQRLEQPTGFTEVVGSIPTEISDNLLPSTVTKQPSVTWLTHGFIQRHFPFHIHNILFLTLENILSGLVEGELFNIPPNKSDP